jgi:hypothetical protein
MASHSSLAPTCNVRRWMVSIVEEITDREESLQQSASAAVWQQGAEFGQHTLYSGVQRSGMISFIDLR